MIDKDVALEALSTLCNANVTSTQNVTSPQAYFRHASGGGAAQQLVVNHLISTILDADETSKVSRSNFVRLRNFCDGVDPGECCVAFDAPTERNYIIDEDEFFDPKFDYDFTNLKDTETYRRGGEVYERPSGWQRFAIKVLDKYDGNTWLGTRYRSTQSVPGEWPVSYHGTSQSGAAGIVPGFYKPGSGQVYGRGIYSTPYIAEAVQYAKTFIHNNQRYQVILQNRINPTYREKHNNGKYWLIPIPAGTSNQEEMKMVERSIRPYGLLLRKV